MLSHVYHFYVLAAIATILLWGISAYNGTVRDLLIAAWTKDLDGLPFETHYTGIFFLDFPIALLVAFFYSGTNGHNSAYQVFLLNAYATLQPAFVWLYVETSRHSGRHRRVSQSPILYGMIWQCFGAAISLPLFYAQHISHLEEYSRDYYHEPYINHALPTAYFLGAVIPVVIGMWPTWAGEIDPVYVASMIWLLRSWISVKSDPYCNDQRSSHHWAKFSLLLAAFTSATGHFYLLIRLVLSGDPNMNLKNMFLPTTWLGRPENGTMLRSGPWLFLQYDFLIIALSSLYWTFCLLATIERQRRSSMYIVAFCLLAGSVIVGAGASVSLALLWREELLWRSRRDTEVNVREVKSVIQKA